MENYLELLHASRLFSGIERAELPALLGCLSASPRRYAAGEFPLLPGDPVPAAGILLSGVLHIVREDALGNRTIVTEIDPGDIFAEALACAHAAHSPVGVEATQKSEILWLDIRRMLTTCSNACSFHAALVSNLLQILAEKNLLLNRRIEVLSERSIRARLLAFFGTAGNKKGTMPFGRTQLADFIAADRSAMTRELSNMQKEGVIRLKKNEFELL